jgi:hypothetical protein
MCPLPRRTTYLFLDRLMERPEAFKVIGQGEIWQRRTDAATELSGIASTRAVASIDHASSTQTRTAEPAC